MKSEAVKNDQKWMESTEPILNELLSDWQLIPVEGQANTVCRILNNACGINYLLFSKTAVYGVISYVTYGENTRTFTVSIDNATFDDNSLSPYYTMQVYVKDDKVIGLGLVKTEDLIDFLESGLALEREVEHVKYYACHWDDMNLAGYDVKEYSLETPASEGKTVYHGTKMPFSCETCDIRDMYNMCEDVVSALGKNSIGSHPF